MTPTQHVERALASQSVVLRDEEARLRPRIVVMKSREHFADASERTGPGELPGRVKHSALRDLDAEEPTYLAALVDRLSRDVEELRDVADGQCAFVTAEDFTHGDGSAKARFAETIRRREPSVRETFDEHAKARDALKLLVRQVGRHVDDRSNEPRLG